MEGAQRALGCGLQVCVLGRLGEVDLLGSNIDQDVLALMKPLEVSSVPFVYLAPGFGDIPMIEAHRWSTYHDEGRLPRRKMTNRHLAGKLCDDDVIALARFTPLGTPSSP
jgi:hypothetical protein